MDRLFIILLFLCSFCGLFAKDYLYDIHSLHVEPKHFIDSIPILCQEGRIYVKIEVNDRPYWFLLDTGASLGELYEESGIVPKVSLGRIRSVRDAVGVEQSSEIIEMPDFKIGKILIKGYPIQQSSRKCQGEVVGTLGFALFNKGVLAKIDVRNHVMILTDKKNCFKKERGFILPYKLQRFIPEVNVLLTEGWNESSIFDTGNHYFFLMNRSRWEERMTTTDNADSYVQSKAIGKGQRGAHGEEFSEQVYFLHLPYLRWGKWQIMDIKTRTVNGSSNIGTGLLKYGSLIINPPKKVLIFQPYDDVVDKAPAPSYSDIYFVPAIDGHAQVGLVRPESKAYNDGFRTGHIIVSINGQAIPTLNAFKDFQFVNGRQYIFRLLHPKGYQHEIEVTYSRAGLSSKQRIQLE